MQKTDYLDIDGKQLRLLLTVYDSGSLTKAAQSLDMNQSTVSYWLDQLRHKFNDPLFIRSGQGVIPTDRTNQLIPQARDLLHALSTFSQQSQYEPAKDNGVLHIAANALERDLFVKPLLKQAENIAPELSFEIHPSGSNHQVAEGLRDGKFDLALFPTGMDAADGIMQRVLVSMESVIFYDNDFTSAPKSMQEYCDCKHARISLGPNAHSIIDNILLEQGLKRNVVLQAGDFDTLAQLMKSTNIITTLPELFKNSCFQQFSTTPMPWKPLIADLAILWHTRQHHALRNQFWRRLITTL